MTPRRSVILIAAVTVTSCDKLPFLVSKEESATRACELRLKNSLTSPSSYQRLSSSFTPAAPITKAEMMDSDEADRERALKEGNDTDAIYATYRLSCLKMKSDDKDCDGLRFEQMQHPPTAFILIEYEAANAFNARLPGFFSCRIEIREDGKYSESSIINSTLVPNHIGKQLKSQAEFIESNAKN